MSYLLRLRILRYRQIPNNLKRVKAHASRREPSSLLLVVSVYLPIFRIQESKTLHNMSVITSLLCYHTRICFLGVIHLLLLEFRQIIVYLCLQDRNVVLDDTPDYHIINLKIFVNDVIAHASNLFPRRGRM